MTTPRAGARAVVTAQARGYLGLGALLVLAGALLSHALLVAAGGILLLLVQLERALAAAHHPRVRLHVASTRVPEEAEVEVLVEVQRARAGQQFKVDLDPGLDVAKGTNVGHLLRRESVHSHRFIVRADVRGPRRVGPLQVRTWSPGRLAAAESDDSVQATLEVLPRHADVDDVDLLSRVLKPSQGRFSVNRPGQGFEFFNLRPYQAGDTQRDINWKASARLDDLIVNQRLRETHSEILLLLDARAVSGVGPSGQAPLDRSCRVAVALFAAALRARDTVRFFSYGAEAVDASPHWEEKVHSVEGYLARLGPAGTCTLEQAWQTARTSMRSHGPVFLLSSLEGDSTTHHAVLDMLQRGHPVTIISPCPTGPTWDSRASAARRADRDRMVQALRGVGAIVVDWAPGAPLAAPRPLPLMGVGA